MAEPTLIAVAWFRREDYDLIRAMFDDGADMPETFDQWQEQVERRLAERLPAGARVEKVIVDPDEFRAFARRVQVKADEQGRSAFAASRARQKARRAN